MVKYCCCCIPLRAGSVIIGILLMLAGAGQAISIYLGKNLATLVLTSLNSALPWVYFAVSCIMFLVGFFGMFAACIGNHSLVRIYARLFWILFTLTLLWHSTAFIIAIIKKGASVDECEMQVAQISNQTISQANATSTSISQNITQGIDPRLGLSSCDAAVNIGLAIIGVTLFFGLLIQMHFGMAISSYATKLCERHRGHRLRDSDWEDHGSVTSLAVRHGKI